MYSISPFIRHLAQLLPSSPANALLEEAPFKTSCIDKGEDILISGASVRQIVTIGQGVAMRYRLLPDGGRQVIMFLTAGDICNSQIYPTVIDHCVAAVTPVRIDRFECDAIIGLTSVIPGLNQALWSMAEEQNAIMRDRITSLGRSDARSRMVLLLKEMALRLIPAGSAPAPVFIPVTQTLLADAVGVTHIHFNRIIGDLAKRDIVRTSRGGLMVMSLKRLEELCDEATVAA